MICKGIFPKKIIQMANKHMERHSTSLAIMKVQTKTIPRYHFIPTKIVKMKMTEK